MRVGCEKLPHAERPAVRVRPDASRRQVSGDRIKGSSRENCRTGFPTQSRSMSVLSESLVITANVLQSAIPLLSFVAYLPQWRKLIATRSSADISLTAWALWSLAGLFACFYAIVQYQLTGRGLTLVVTSVISLALILATVVLIVTYRRMPVATGGATPMRPPGWHRDK